MYVKIKQLILSFDFFKNFFTNLLLPYNSFPVCLGQTFPRVFGLDPTKLVTLLLITKYWVTIIDYHCLILGGLFCP